MQNVEKTLSPAATPIVSLSKLCHYVVAGAPRRVRLLERQKRPERSYHISYRAARRAICDYLLCDRNDAMLQDALDRLEAEGAGSERAQRERDLNALAITTFRCFADELDLSGLSIAPAPRVAPLRVGEVAVTIRPDLTVRKALANTTRVGALHLYFARSEPLSDESARTMGSLLYEIVRRDLADTPSRKQTLVIDVFAQRIFRAPRAYARRMSNVTAACREIEAIWEVI